MELSKTIAEMKKDPAFAENVKSELARLLDRVKAEMIAKKETLAG